jgi:hypothetical protein
MKKVIVNIEKLIGAIYMSDGESADKVKRRVYDAILDAVKDANLADGIAKPSSGNTAGAQEAAATRFNIAVKIRKAVADLNVFVREAERHGLTVIFEGLQSSSLKSGLSVQIVKKTEY